jgi:hypothetical protein
MSPGGGWFNAFSRCSFTSKPPGGEDQLEVEALIARAKEIHQRNLGKGIPPFEKEGKST